MDLIKTEIGIIGKENIKYLIQQGVLNNDYCIRYKLINGAEFRRPVHLWSIYRLVFEDIANETGIKDTDGVITVMREGLNLNNQMYPKVESLIETGKRLVFNSYVGERKTRRNIDLDNF